MFRRIYPEPPLSAYCAVIDGQKITGGVNLIVLVIVFGAVGANSNIYQTVSIVGARRRHSNNLAAAELHYLTR